jgi:arachidonate 15-lipoxygenase
LVQEAFNLAMHNCLAPNHPLHRLLAPHFIGTFAINNAAQAKLTATAAGVDEVLTTSIASSIRIGAEALKAYDFNEFTLPNRLRSRGLLGTDELVDYPYRDDALLVWRTIHDWVDRYARLYYRTDADVAGDVELQAFVRQVGQYREASPAGLVGGGIRGVGEPEGSVVSRTYLVQMLTQIIWNGSGEHAAVNFSQELMTYIPNQPGFVLGPLPEGYEQADALTWLRQLPTLDGARNQYQLTALLSSVRYNMLGDYPMKDHHGHSHFGNDAATQEAGMFQSALGKVEATIEERNEQRVRPYPYLLPSKIPGSVNI